MYGAVSFYNTLKYSGFRPIIGYEAFVAGGSRLDRSPNFPAGELPYYHLVLLAENFEGYKNLVYLASKAFTDGFYHRPRIDLELLAEHSKGLIGLSAGSRGAISHFLRNGNDERAKTDAGRLEDIFGKGRFYLEIQDHKSDDGQLVSKIADLAKESDLPLIAANDCHYIERDDAVAHGVLNCIADGRTLDKANPMRCPPMSTTLNRRMRCGTSFGAEYPEALQNTCRIAEMCHVEIPMGEGNLQLPDYPIPANSGCTTTNEYFESVLADGFAERKRKSGTRWPSRDIYVTRWTPTSNGLRKRSRSSRT